METTVAKQSNQAEKCTLAGLQMTVAEMENIKKPIAQMFVLMETLKKIIEGCPPPLAPGTQLSFSNSFGLSVRISTNPLVDAIKWSLETGRDTLCIDDNGTLIVVDGDKLDEIFGKHVFDIAKKATQPTTP